MKKYSINIDKWDTTDDKYLSKDSDDPLNVYNISDYLANNKTEINKKLENIRPYLSDKYERIADKGMNIIDNVSEVQRKPLSTSDSLSFKPIQRFSLSGAWNKAKSFSSGLVKKTTSVASNIVDKSKDLYKNNKLVQGIVKASPLYMGYQGVKGAISLGKGAVNLYNSIDKKYINMAGKFASGAVNAVSAGSKIAMGTALMGTGFGAGVGAMLYAGAAIDANNAWRDIHGGLLYSKGQTEEQVKKNEMGLLDHIVGKDNMDSTLVKSFGLATDVVNIVGGAKKLSIKLAKKAATGSEVRKLGYKWTKNSAGDSKIVSNARKYFQREFDSLKTFKGWKKALKPEFKAFTSKKGWGQVISKSGGDVANKTFKPLGAIDLLRNPQSLFKEYKLADGFLDRTQEGIKVYGSVKNAYDFVAEGAKGLGISASMAVDYARDGKIDPSVYRYAKSNRHQSNPINKQVQAQQNNNSNINQLEALEDKLDELAMKIYRQLNNEVQLEYVRTGYA